MERAGPVTGEGVLCSRLVDADRDDRRYMEPLLSLSLSTTHHGYTLVTYTHQHPTELLGSTKEPTQGFPNPSPEKQTS